MTPTLTCPNCQHRFRLPAEHAGAKIPCPRCEHLVGLPAEAGPADVMEAPTTLRPPRPPEEDVVEADEDVRRRSGERGFSRARAAERGRQAACCLRRGAASTGRPCSTTSAVRNASTPTTGSTGRSNLLPAIVFVTIPALIIAGLLTFIGVILYQHMF